MKKTHCDICNRTENIRSIAFKIGRQPGGAGDMENIYYTPDLCDGCLVNFILTVVERDDYEIGRKLRDWVHRNKKIQPP